MGRSRLFIGGQYDRILLMGEGSSDSVSRQGSVTSATSTTLSDTAATFTDEMVGYAVMIVRGTGEGQRRTISEATSTTQLTVSEAWTTTPDTTSRYALQYAIRGTVTSAAAGTLVDSSKTFDSHLSGAPVAIIDGTGSGQTRVIKTASGTTLTLVSNWTTTPDTTSTYLVGAIEWTWRGGAREIPISEDSTRDDGKRYFVLSYKPTTDAASLDWRIYYDHESTAESLKITGGEAGRSTTLNSDDDIVDLKLTRSSQGNSPGFEIKKILARSTLRSGGHRHIAPELHGYQAIEQITIYKHRLVGMD